MNDSTKLATTQIDETVFKYFFVVLVLISIITIVGIPLLIILLPWFIVWYKPRYNQYHTMTLTEKSLDVKTGVVFRSEVNIPLDRITDATVAQGPLMRYFGVYGMTIETAGQTRLKGTANITGIKNPYELRDKIIKQREKIGGMAPTATKSDVQPIVQSDVNLLKEIRDTLNRIEKQNAGGKSGTSAKG